MRERLRRFAVVGLVATAVDVLLLVGLRRAGCTLVVADLAALAAAALVARPMHRLVTLRDDPFARWIRSPGLFISVVLAAGSVDLLVPRRSPDRATLQPRPSPSPQRPSSGASPTGRSSSG